MATESEQIRRLEHHIAGLQKTVFDLQEKFVAGGRITCPVLANLEEQVKALQERHAEDIAEITSRLTE